jgi:hypothetical protein
MSDDHRSRARRPQATSGRGRMRHQENDPVDARGYARAGLYVGGLPARTSASESRWAVPHHDLATTGHRPTG